jgi:hypothetical protein
MFQFRLGMLYLVFVFWGSAVASQMLVMEGPRIVDYKKLLGTYYAEGNRFEEKEFIPLESGGTTFSGLVVRLLGERLDDKLEGLNVKRYLYHVYKDKRYVGIAHGSSFLYNDQPANVFIFYGLDRVIQDIKVENLPPEVMLQLTQGNFLTQFKGRKVEDFEKQSIRVGRGRRKQSAWRKGEFFSDAKVPATGAARKAFDGIFRSVRFNAAFMDVAFFITKHPDLDNDSEKISSNIAISGPEKAAEEMERNNMNKR